jgi:hypothetical protein
MYFARTQDAALVLRGECCSGQISNVLVAVSGWGGRKKIIALTEIWTDGYSRPHSLAALKLQIAFNDAQKAAAYNPLRPGQAAEFLVEETGILDRSTLEIPHKKLSIRIRKIASQIQLEYFTAQKLTATDPGASALKRKYAAYVSDKLGEASTRMGDLHQAIQAVPMLKTYDMPTLTGKAQSYGGLSGLEFDGHGLNQLPPDGSGDNRYRSAQDNLPPELSIREFADPAGLTPAVVADLQQKESAAAKAVDFAENLCNDLLTYPCR